MNIGSLARLPWKIKDVVRAVRRDIAASRHTMAQVLQMIAALEAKHGDLELKHNELIDVLLENDRRWERTRRSSHEELLAEIREQGLLTETAARLPARAAAERKLRDQLPSPHSPPTGYERVDHLLEPRQLSWASRWRLRSQRLIRYLPPERCSSLTTPRVTAVARPP